jgi:hypothetical protein
MVYLNEAIFLLVVLTNLLSQQLFSPNIMQNSLKFFILLIIITCNAFLTNSETYLSKLSKILRISVTAIKLDFSSIFLIFCDSENKLLKQSTIPFSYRSEGSFKDDHKVTTFNNFCVNALLILFLYAYKKIH